MVTLDDIIKWLSSGSDKANSLIDLKWNIKQSGNYTALQNDKIPFNIFLYIDDEKKNLNLIVRTGIETATIENQPRLGIYRTLLILNEKTELVKFMLDGINEEVIAREDFDMSTLTKDVLNTGLNTILAAFYLMVKALNLEDEFNSSIVERTAMMIQDMAKSGKTRDEIKTYLVSSLGLNDNDADKLISEVLNAGSVPKNMYE
ncbi:hypothetical protein [Ferroplasma sp.]|uniref:hypothetical protein n=1 Tax=Ferroplasma sp. TaxID=2591003 RepID=UPI00307EECEF